MFSLSSGALVLGLAASAQARIVEHWWNITYATANPDGLQERRVIGVNGSWPPPPVNSHTGDTIRIHATNGLGVDHLGTALHAHGMMFNNSNWFDGAVGVTQCPIPPGETMTYDIDTSIQHGTYWIHGHHKGQYVDGLRTPSVIIPLNGTGRSDNVTWDDEYTLVVSDWYHREHDDMLYNDFLTWKNPTGAEPVPESALIYVVKNDTYFPSAQAINDGSGTNNNAKLVFEAGKKYRVRMINMAALSMFYVNFDQHDVQLIEVDGVEIEPYSITENELGLLTISVAQRYSVLVTAKNETDTNYALSVLQSEDMYDAIPPALVLNNTLQIVYADGNANAESPEFAEYPILDDSKFVPILKQEQAPADVEYRLDVFFDTYDDGTNRASFNNVTYISPPVPSIFTALSMGENALLTQVYGAQTSAFAYKHMQNIQLTVYNWDAGFHPFHLHGHEFQVVSKSFDVTSNDTAINPPVREGMSNPSRRDTITIPPTGNVVLRWRADNPGAWFFHCHIDWHLSSGLAAVFIEAPEVFQQNASIVPTELYDQCKYWNTATSGNVVGKESVTDFKGQPWGPFPLVMGWTPKAIGALAGCILTALVGFGTVVWYGWGGLDEDELEEEVKRKLEAKKAKGSLLKRMTGRS